MVWQAVKVIIWLAVIGVFLARVKGVEGRRRKDEGVVGWSNNGEKEEE